MKPIHECAVIKDGNERIGYMICETTGINNILSIPWSIVDASTFENLVANNKVQYLIWENNTIKCRYDLEEIRSMKKVMNKELLRQTQNNYFDLDIQFKARHIKAANSNARLAVCLAGVQKVFGIPMISMLMYGNIIVMGNLMYLLESKINAQLTGFYKHNGNNIGQLVLPLKYFDTLINDLGRKLLFNTSTLKFMLRNDIKLRKIPIIQSTPNPEAVLSIVNKLDRLTLDNERKLGI